MLKTLRSITPETQSNPDRSPHLECEQQKSLRKACENDSETAFIEALKRELPGSFETLVRRHKQQILRLAFRITHNHEDAEDVMQETFLRVHSHIGSFRGDSKLGSWVTRIAINQSLMQRRKRRESLTSVDDQIEAEEGHYCIEVRDVRKNPLETVLLTEIDKWCSESIKKLPTGFRTIAELYFLSDQTTQEISQSSGLSIPAVKARIHRARKALRGSSRAVPIRAHLRSGITFPQKKEIGDAS